MSLRKISQGIGLCIAALLFTGCAATQNKQDLATFNQNLKTGQYQQALDFAKDSGDFNKEGKTDDLLWALQAAHIASLIEDYPESNAIYDQAEDFMKDEDLESLPKEGFEKMGALLINNSVNDYEQTVFDSVMVNTYKGLNNIFLQDWQNARIEFNRAADRQRRAKEHFSKKIADQEKDLKKQKKGKTKGAPTVNYSDSEKLINENFVEMDKWKSYGDYINPYTDYLHGLYFMLAAAQGNKAADYEKAVYSFKRVYGTAGKNSVIAKDLSMARNLQSGKWKRNNIRPQVWVIFENGLAPTLDQIIIPIPLFVVTNEISYVQLALPKIVEEQKAYDKLNISSSGKKIGCTTKIASMDRVIKAEFKKEYPFMVTEAIIQAVVKGTLQYVAEDQLQIFGAIGGALYQAATTHADTRSWSALPKEVQALRIRKPKSGKITLNGTGMLEPVEVTLPESRYSIVHVRAAGSPSQPVVRVVGFN